MNHPARSLVTILRQQSARIAMLTAAVAITFAGWRWVSLERNSIYVGAISPSGKQFVSYTLYETWDTWAVTAHVRDVDTGKVLHDLSRFPLPWGTSSIAWVDEKTLVANVMDEDSSNLARAGRSSTDFQSMLTIRLDQHLTIIEKRKPSEQRMSSVRITGNREIAFAVVEQKMKPRCVNIYKAPLGPAEGGSAPRLLSSLEFGSDEQAYCFRAADSERDILIVEVRPTTTAPPKGNFVVTDGVSQTTLVVSLKTGEVLHEVRGGYQPIPHSLEFLAKQTATGIDICRIENVEEVVATIRPKHSGKLEVVAFDERRSVIREELPSSDVALRVIDADRSTEREFRFTEWANASNPQTNSGSHLLVASEGRLDRIGLAGANQKKQLVSVRPFARFLAATSMVGAPLLVFCILFWLVRANSRAVFFDIPVACTFVACSLMILGQTADAPPGLFLSAAFGFLGAALAVLLIWVSTSKTIYGLGIPLITISLAGVILLCNIAWPHSAGAAIAFVGLSLLLFFQSIGHVLFGRFVGRIVAGDIDDGVQMQFSVRQAGVFTASFGVLLACLRWVAFGDNSAPIAIILWIVLFVAVCSACILFAQWCAFGLANRLASFILCLAGTVSAVVCFHLLGFLLWPNPTLELYIQPVIAAMVVWTTLQIARRSGYRLHGRLSVAAEGNVAY